MNTQWQLKQYMKARRIRPGDLAKETQGQLSRAGIYGLLSEERPTSVHFSTLDALLPALERITGKPVAIGDLIAYGPPTAPSEPPQAWRKLIGALQDPDSPGDVAERHDYYLGEALAEEHEESLRGER